MYIVVKFAFVIWIFDFVLAQDYEDVSIRKQKLGSCLYLIKKKLEVDKENINYLIEGLPQEIELIARDKIIADILIRCVNKITKDEAIKFWDKLELLPEHEYLFEFDKNQFGVNREIKLSKEQIALFEEVKLTYKEISDYQEKELKKSKDDFSFLENYQNFIKIVGIFISFSISIYTFTYFFFRPKNKRVLIIKPNSTKNQHKKID